MIYGNEAGLADCSEENNHVKLLFLLKRGKEGKCRHLKYDERKYFIADCFLNSMAGTAITKVGQDAQVS
jgi:hypothetical protein